MRKTEKTTFDVRLFCRSCENDWKEEIDKGIFVRYEKDNNYMIGKGEPEKNKKYFRCPSCGSSKKIARLPLVKR